MIAGLRFSFINSASKVALFTPSKARMNASRIPELALCGRRGPHSGCLARSFSCSISSSLFSRTFLGLATLTGLGLVGSFGGFSAAAVFFFGAAAGFAGAGLLTAGAFLVTGLGVGFFAADFFFAA